MQILDRILARTDEEAWALAAEVCEYLNSLIALDRGALQALMEHRVPTKSLADHLTVQVAVSAGDPTLGLLGVINGFVGVQSNGWGYVAAVFDDKGDLVKFEPYRRATDA